MATSNDPLSTLQADLAAVTQTGQAIANQVAPKDAAQINRVSGYVNLGIAVLPVFASLFHAFGDLFHHTHAAAVAMNPVPPASAEVAKTASTDVKSPNQ